MLTIIGAIITPRLVTILAKLRGQNENTAEPEKCIRGSCEKIGIKRYSPPCITALLCPTSFAEHGGIEDNWRESRSPLLAQGGVAAPIKKMPRSLLSGRRRGGWFKPPIIGS